MPVIKPKICFVLTAEFAVKAFLVNHLRALSQIYDVTVIVNTNNPNFLAEAGIKAKVIPLKISRDISIFSDLICLFKLVKIFHQQRFAAVHSMMPKSGLLTMLAAWMVRVPIRVHTFTGQVWVTKNGFKRFMLKRFDCLIAFLSTINIVDGHSQRQFLLDEGVIKQAKSIVFACGSISGVDVNRFKPNAEAKERIRKQLAIAENDMLFLFLGRLNTDKGVLDLANAFSQLPVGAACLLFTGPDEKNMQIKIESILAKKLINIRFVGYTDLPEHYMAAADVLCLPSYREGFGSVIIEAAAVGIPVVASRIYGTKDAVVENETGLLHEPGDIEGIKSCMQQLIQNKALRLKLGQQARQRVISDFDSHLITRAWVDFYREHLH